MSNELQARFSYMKSQLITCASTNFLFNGLCYYFLSGGKEKSAVEFCINGTITAFILALICGAIGALTVDAKCKKGALPLGTYTWESNMIVSKFPKKGKLGQTVAAAIMVTIKFVFICAGVPVLVGCAGKTIPVLEGAILHGICAGAMAMFTMYYMLVARCATYYEEHKND